MHRIPTWKILSLDTSSPRGSVALLEGADAIGELRLFSLETHSARLLRSIQFLLESAGWRLQDLNLVCAGIGPGSFTGIRIGLSTALGVAQTLGIPFAGVSGLDALAEQASFLEGRIGVVMDAQRNQVYHAEYSCSKGRIRLTKKPVLCYPSELRRRFGGRRIYIVGDGTIRYPEELGIRAHRWPRFVAVDLFLAAAIGRLGLVRRRTWRSGQYLKADPLYIRPPDALRSKAVKEKDVKDHLSIPAHR